MLYDVYKNDTELTMKTSNNKKILRIISLLLVIICLIPSVSACKARPLAQTKLAKTQVGMISEHPVLYEEFYFLASNYHNALKAQYGDDTEGLKAAVWEKVCENIVSDYYAILELCRIEGIVYDESELKKEVEAQIEIDIENNFEGSRSRYIKSQEEVGLTDHYVRFTIGAEILYNRLETKYRESGVIPNTDEKITAYIKENLIHTWHLAVVVNEADDRSEKLAKAKDLLSRLKSGESFYSLMKYSEDFYSNSLPNVDGTYFHKGEMTPEYEEASLALNVGQTSDIITSTARQSNGSMLECFYIIQRLPIVDAEIEANFNALSNTVASAIVAEKVESVKAALSFVPNTYAKSLEVTALEKPKNGADYQLILIITASVIVVACAIIAVILIRRAKVKKFHNRKKK